MDDTLPLCKVPRRPYFLYRDIQIIIVPRITTIPLVYATSDRHFPFHTEHTIRTLTTTTTTTTITAAATTPPSTIPSPPPLLPAPQVPPPPPSRSTRTHHTYPTPRIHLPSPPPRQALTEAKNASHLPPPPPRRVAVRFTIAVESRSGPAEAAQGWGEGWALCAGGVVEWVGVHVPWCEGGREFVLGVVLGGGYRGKGEGK